MSSLELWLLSQQGENNCSNLLNEKKIQDDNCSGRRLYSAVLQGLSPCDISKKSEENLQLNNQFLIEEYATTHLQQQSKAYDTCDVKHEQKEFEKNVKCLDWHNKLSPETGSCSKSGLEPYNKVPTTQIVYVRATNVPHIYSRSDCGTSSNTFQSNTGSHFFNHATVNPQTFGQNPTSCSGSNNSAFSNNVESIGGNIYFNNYTNNNYIVNLCTNSPYMNTCANNMYVNNPNSQLQQGARQFVTANPTNINHPYFVVHQQQQRVHGYYPATPTHAQPLLYMSSPSTSLRPQPRWPPPHLKSTHSLMNMPQQPQNAAPQHWAYQNQSMHKHVFAQQYYDYYKPKSRTKRQSSTGNGQPERNAYEQGYSVDAGLTCKNPSSLNSSCTSENTLNLLGSTCQSSSSINYKCCTKRATDLTPTRLLSRPSGSAVSSSVSEDLERQAIEQYNFSNENLYQELELQAEEQYEHSENWNSPSNTKILFGGLALESDYLMVFVAIFRFT